VSGKSKVLIVEDEHALASALAFICRRLDCEVQLAAGGRAGLFHFAEKEPDLVILDVGLPDIGGLQVLREMRAARPDCRVLVITAHGNLENAIESRKSGAADYLVKPLDLTEFEQTVAGLLAARAKALSAAEPDVSGNTERSEDSGRQGAVLIGAAQSMQPLFTQLASACVSRMPVLVSGPPGSGRTTAGMVVHRNGLRSGGELRIVDASEGLDESALGLPQSSTLLIERLEDLPQRDQRLLADFLRKQSESDALGPRVVAICGTDLAKRVRESQFGEELFYQLSVFEARVPALKDRLGDLPALVAYFLGETPGGSATRLTPEALDILSRYDWPGNLRELRDTLAYARVLCGGLEITPRHLPAMITRQVASAGKARLPVGDHSAIVAQRDLERALAAWLDVEFSSGRTPSYLALLERVESTLLRDLLGRFQGKPTRLATSLTMNRSTLRRKLARLPDAPQE
jgi:DNA-binding NtrC family response regulator